MRGLAFLKFDTLMLLSEGMVRSAACAGAQSSGLCLSLKLAVESCCMTEARQTDLIHVSHATLPVAVL